MHIKGLSDFNFFFINFSLTPLIAYSFLLASILKNKINMDLSIIIPLYNENESIITLSHEIELVCRKK